MVKQNVFLALILVTVVTAGAYAGTLRGKVSSMTKSGVVYVDRIAGKTFPATTVPYQIDQHGQSFEPRVLVIPQGATVVFKNSDTVAHNVRWPAISGDKSLAHNLGTWASGDDRKFRFDRPVSFPCCAICTRRWLDTSSWCLHRTTRTPRLPVITPCAIFPTGITA